MPTIVKAEQAQDFLALVPALVGFQPERSLVLVAFRGNRTCGALRFSLPAEKTDVVAKRVATTALGMVCKIPRVDALVPVVYADELFSAGERPWGALVGALCDRASQSGFLVRDALCVAGDGWISYLEDDPPPLGHPLEEIEASPVNKALPALDERPRMRAELPALDLAVRQRVARHYRRFGELPSHPELIDTLAKELAVLLDPVELAEVSLGWDPQGAETELLGLLLFVVQGPANRDQMMVQFAFGRSAGERAFALNCYYSAVQRSDGRSMDEIIAEDLASGTCDITQSDLILGRTAERPDAARIRDAIALLRVLVSAAPRSARPAPLCMLAWLSWCLGLGSVAGEYVDRALDIDRDYGMAQVLWSLFASGSLPEWAFNVPLEDEPAHPA